MSRDNYVSVYDALENGYVPKIDDKFINSFNHECKFLNSKKSVRWDGNRYYIHYFNVNMNYSSIEDARFLKMKKPINEEIEIL